MNTLPASAPEKQHRFEILDLARFCAAMAVVLFHYYFRGWVTGGQSPLRFPVAGPCFQYGYLGVQFFFIISGFVIFMSAQGRSAGEFARARFLRLFPAYWFAVLLTASVIAVWGAPTFKVSLSQVVVNLTMLQQLFHVAHVDGVYWTLTYELVFYAWIFGLLRWSRLARFDRWAAAALTVSSAVLVVAMPGWAKLLLLADYSPYFIAGALFHRWAVGRIGRRDALLLGWAALLCIAHAYAETDEQSTRYATPMSGTVVVLWVTAMLGFFVTVATGMWRRFRWRHAALVGSLTYPLYLIHQTIGYTVFNLFPSDAFASSTAALTIAGGLLISAFIAIVWEPRMRQALSERWPPIRNPNVRRAVQQPPNAL